MLIFQKKSFSETVIAAVKEQLGLKDREPTADEIVKSLNGVGLINLLENLKLNTDNSVNEIEQSIQHRHTFSKPKVEGI